MALREDIFDEVKSHKTSRTIKDQELTVIGVNKDFHQSKRIRSSQFEINLLGTFTILSNYGRHYQYKSGPKSYDS
jgi:hypothetical protein